MTRRLFLQAIPGVVPLCHTSELPPSMSLAMEEFQQVDDLIAADGFRVPDRQSVYSKARAILRAAVREGGPVNQQKKDK